MNNFLLILLIYLLSGIAFNLFGPLARKIKEEFKKLDQRQFASEVISKIDENTFTKQKLIKAKIILRLLSVLFFPFFLIILAISFFQDKKHNLNKPKTSKSVKKEVNKDYNVETKKKKESQKNNEKPKIPKKISLDDLGFLYTIEPPLFFSKLKGFGEIKCNDCDFSQRISGHTHSGKNRTNAYQCKNCGKFEDVKTTVGDEPPKLICNNCGGQLTRDEQLFCPECKSKNISYGLMFMT